MAKFAALLLFVVAATVIGLGIALVAFAKSAGPVNDLGVGTPIAASIVIFGVVALLAVIGILFHRGWARGLGLLVSLAGMVLGGAIVWAARSNFSGDFDLGSGTRHYAVSAPDTATLAAAAIPLVVFALIFLALLIGGKHFRKVRVT